MKIHNHNCRCKTCKKEKTRNCYEFRILLCFISILVILIIIITSI